MNQSDIQVKLDTVSENLDRLTQLPLDSYEEFARDFRNTDSALHRLQTAIQALTDIGAYVVSSLGLRTPTSTIDVIEVLRESDLIAASRAPTYIKMVQFRNRVVHLYNRVDHRVIYDIVTRELDDIREFYDRLLSIIEDNPDEEKP